MILLLGIILSFVLCAAAYGLVSAYAHFIEWRDDRKYNNRNNIT
jgi:hypothetical protein